MQPAFAAKAGVVSAFMSARGITGSRDFLEGQYGFFNLYEGGDYDGRRLLDRLGDRYEGMSLSMKPYPSCRMTHGSIDAALALKREYAIDAGSVEGIVVHVSEMSHNMVGMPFEIRTDAQVDAQFSIPYTVSVAMLHGDVSLEDFRDSAIRDKSVKEFSKRITVLADPSLPVRDMSRATVEVRCGSDFYRKTIDGLKGSPANPMSLDECIRKFRNCVSSSIRPVSEEKIENILDRLVHLDRLGDVRILMGMLG
jgi:2-methylcitrate dehydratase PrpD